MCYHIGMRKLALRTLRVFWENGHADAEQQLRAWFQIVEKMDWNSFSEVKATFPSVDFVGDKAIFNIKTNRYRLIAKVNFQSKHVLIRWIGTHAEYDRLTKKEIENL